MARAEVPLGKGARGQRQLEEMSRGAHPKLVIGFYEPVKSEGVPKGFPFDDNLEEFAELSSRKGRCNKSCEVENRIGQIRQEVK